MVNFQKSIMRDKMIKHGRTKIVCIVCEKEKIHFGLNMCSGCLRCYKRKTKPSFYLGTCYSEIKRRCTTKTEKRPKYYGKKYCTKEEFMNKFLTDKTFLEQYSLWQKSGYKRGSAPSIDRIDNNGDYLLDNLRFVSNIENGIKERIRNVYQYDIKKNFVKSYQSLKEASNLNNIPVHILFNRIHNGRLYNNYYWSYMYENKENP